MILVYDYLPLTPSTFPNNPLDLRGLLTQPSMTTQTDPYQVNNLHPHVETKNATILGYDIPAVIDRLDALLLVLKSCKGRTCIKPWEVLHPDGSVQNLLDALRAQYDGFYHDQPKVSYDRCEYGYVIDAEGPQTALAYRNGYSLDLWI